MNKFILTFFIFMLISACTTHPTLTSNSSNLLSETPEIKHCRIFYTQLIKQIDRQNIIDAQTQRVLHYPYLASNRFLAQLKHVIQTPSQLHFWLEQLRLNGQNTLQLEIHNLSLDIEMLTAFNFDEINTNNLAFTKKKIYLQSEKCSKLLLSQDFPISNGIEMKRLLDTDIEDEYQEWKRIIGLYALSAAPFSAGIHFWHSSSQRQLKTPYTQLPIRGQLIRYLPELISTKPKQTTEQIFTNSQNNSLNMPLPNTESLKHLFQHHAPIFEIDISSKNDKIGSPKWTDKQAIPLVDTQNVEIYTLVSYTFINGNIHLQLNYISWFPSRECSWFFDLLCGHMDGITWRVTLDQKGKPIIYDSVHNCGCYHTFFPTQSVTPKAANDNLDEEAFSPIQAPTLGKQQRIVLRISSTEHHIIALYADQPKSENTSSNYRLSDYDELRSLTIGSLAIGSSTIENRHRRNLFEQDGLIKNTERLERWFFWPMGINSAGAMRQWGSHATAFIGRRHFDDPCLFENSFRFTQTEKPQIKHNTTCNLTDQY